MKYAVKPWPMKFVLLLRDDNHANFHTESAQDALGQAMPNLLFGRVENDRQIEIAVGTMISPRA